MIVSNMTVARLTESERNTFITTLDLLDRIESTASLAGYNNMSNDIHKLVQHFEIFVTKYIRNENEVWFK